MTPYLTVATAKPDLEAFLFAAIGEDGNGMTLSVLSGLSRLNIDPWDEARRLAQLPRERAIEALERCIGQLPPGAWQVSDMSGIASRLVDLLPRREAAVRAVSATGAPASASATKPTATTTLWLIAAGIAASLAFGLPARVERLFAGDDIAIPLVRPAAQSAPRQ